MINVETSHPIAETSLDHLVPRGTVNDNSTNQDYIFAAKRYFGKDQLKVLDLGCAGGQMVVDFITYGDYAVGIEGSTEARQRGAGKRNWDEFGDINLFNADLTKFYQITDNGEPVKFDFISSWEVFEHIGEDDLPMFFENIKRHLADDGILTCSVSVDHDCGHDENGSIVDWHQSVFNTVKWLNIIYANGFEIVSDPRWNSVPICVQTGHWPGQEPQGVVLKRQGLFFGYVLGDAMLRNHDNWPSSIYFCLRKKA